MGPIGRRKKYRKPGDEVERNVKSTPNDSNTYFVKDRVVPPAAQYDEFGKHFLRFKYETHVERIFCMNWLESFTLLPVKVLVQNNPFRKIITDKYGNQVMEPYCYIPINFNKPQNATPTTQQPVDDSSDSDDDSEEDYDDGDEDYDE